MAGPAFDGAVAPGGYAWWYLDALSDDGEHGLTLIAFLGSVFSPYYAWARRRAPGGAADPLDHCAVNVALYGRGSQRWAMTERGRGSVHRAARSLHIGPSALHWQDDRLTVEIDEIAVPWPARLRGVVTLHAPHRFDRWYGLAPGHGWCPIAPSARIEVDLREPRMRWSGRAYFDSNRGNGPLERAFHRWDWSRAHLPDGRSVVLYDVQGLQAEPVQIGLQFDETPSVRAFDAPPPAALPGTRWRIERRTRCDAGAAPQLVRTLTDAPFYARSLLRTQVAGEPVVALHESLSLPRFGRPWVQAMLPFRMPRRG